VAENPRTGGKRPVVIANGAEGEPASAKDRTLLTRAPHLVLDGLQLAAGAVGAGEVYLYLPAALADRLRAILTERTASGWDPVRVHVVIAPDSFLAGEESAVVSTVEGHRPLPRDKSTLIVKSGVRKAPSLVQNVETLAQIGLLARYGPEWLRRTGTVAEPGTFLATVSGAVRAPGVYETPYGTALGDLLDRAGGAAAPLRAVLVGGYHGGWLPPDPGLPLSRDGLRPLGGSPGAGVVVALSTMECGLRYSARVAGYLAGQSARQCGPCRNGLPRMADTLARLANAGPVSAHEPGLPAEVERMAALVTGRGACHHPDGSARFVRSACNAFGDDVRAHLAGYCLADHRTGV
jgi:NADH:ubiquinone oxidoreductase subunit F (NADH-binding)